MQKEDYILREIEKIGQMLMLSYPGTGFTDEQSQVMNDHLEAGYVGGLIFFKFNPEQCLLCSGQSNPHPAI